MSGADGASGTGPEVPTRLDALQRAADPYCLALATADHPRCASLMTERGLYSAAACLDGSRSSNRQAVGAVLAKRYSAGLLMPQIALRYAGFEFRADPRELRALVMNGLPVGLALEPASVVKFVATPCSEAAFATTLMETYAAPLVAGLRACFDAPLLVIFSNIAVQIESLLRLRSATETSFGESIREALVRLASEFGVKGRSILPPARPVNLSHYGIVDHLWRRRVCCMANQLSLDLCATCPLQGDEGAAASIIAEQS